LKIGFKIASDLKSRAMAIALQNNIVHCEIILSNGNKCASWNTKGTGIFERQKPKNTEVWKYINLPIALEPKVIEWFKKNQGKPYNWVGIAGGIFIKTSYDSLGFHCSEACYTALKQASMELPTLDPATVRPADLFKMIEKTLTNQ
jgi:hypothetical protein